LPAIVLLFVTSGVDVAWGSSGCILTLYTEADEEKEAPASGSWRTRLEQSLKAMWAGSLEDRLEAIADADELLDPDGDEDEEGPDNPTPEEIADRLIEFLDSEPDEWVVWNLLDTLEFDEGETVRSLFRAALSSFSPTLRAKAAEFYMLEEDAEAVPRLEELWDAGVPEWGLDYLMFALVNQGSTMHLPAFLRRTGDSDPRVRRSAILALAGLHDEATLPHLLTLARADDSLTRGAAIEALGEWEDSQEVVGALVRAIRFDPVWRARALDALLQLDGTDRDESLLEILKDPEAQDLWAHAAQGLENSTRAGTEETMVGALEEAAARDLQSVVHGLIIALHNRDDASALPPLLNLDPGIGAGSFVNVRRLIDYLGRDRDSTNSYSISRSPSWKAPTEDGETSHVVAAGAAQSVRCWQGPGVAFGSWRVPRVPEGSRVTISSHFDRAGETWAQIDGDGTSGCWIPMRLLADGPGPGSTPAQSRPEFDVPSGALRTSTARTLIEDGVIEILDEDDPATGIAVNLVPDGPTLQDLLERLKSATRRSVEDQMEEVLGLLAKREGGEGEGSERQAARAGNVHHHGPVASPRPVAARLG
jgi:HEAT repeat protein